MNPAHRLAQAAEALCATVLDAPRLTLEQRVEALTVTLSELLAAGLALPPAPAGEPPPPAPGAEDFPGLGSFDDALRLGSPLDPGADLEPSRTSDAVLFAAAVAWSGLEPWQGGDPETAVARWAATWTRGSAEALFALGVLHEARRRFRPEPRRRRGPRVEPVPLSPQPERGWLGVRFEPLGLGVLVREVAPESPAADRVQPGDVLMSADEVNLDSLDPAEIARRLVPMVGEQRTVEVYRDGATHEIRIIGVARGTGPLPGVD